MAEPKQRVPDDVVEYRLFPDVPESVGKADIQKYLEEQIDVYLAHLSPLLVEYIWQNEPFYLRIVPASGPGEYNHLSVERCFAAASVVNWRYEHDSPKPVIRSSKSDGWSLFMHMRCGIIQSNEQWL